MSGKRYHYKGFMLIVCLILSLVAGCTDGGNKDGASESPKGAETPAKQTEPVKIDFLAYDSYADPNPDSEIVKQVEKKFNAKFDFWYVDPAKWDEVLNTRFSAGEMPDLLKITGTNLSVYVKNGILSPIDEKTIRQYAPSYAAILDQYPESWNSVKYEGKLYGIPRINVNGTYPTSIVWRKDWLDNVGITKVPSTIQEAEEALTKFRNEDPDKNGKKDTYGMSDYAIPTVLSAFGYPGVRNIRTSVAEFYIRDGNAVWAPIQPEMKDALELLQQWYKKGLIDPEFITGETPSGYFFDSQALYNGRIGLTSQGMFYHWRDALDPNNPDDKGGRQYVTFKKSQPNGELVFGPALDSAKAEGGSPQWSDVSNPIGLTVKGAENPQILETYLKLVEASTTDKAFRNLIRYGIEGTDWKYTSDGKTINNLRATNNSQEIAKQGIGVFSYMQNPAFEKEDNMFLYNFASKVSPAKGYPVPVLPQIDMSKYASSLNKLTLEYYVKIITGNLPASAFDEFVKKFNDNGGAQLQKQMNDSYRKMIGK